MRKLGVSLAIFALLGNAAIAQKNNYQVNAVAFYNVENLHHPSDDPNTHDSEFTPTGANKYTYEIYNKKLQNLSKVIAGFSTDKLSKYQIPNGPAIIGLSEIENRQVIEELIAQPDLKNRNYRIVHFDSPDARGVDVGLIYRPDLFQVINAKSHYVDITKEGSSARTRDILEVTGLLSGDTVTVLVNHWPSRSGGEAASMWKREAAALVCNKIADSLERINPAYRLIIMGDFNDDPISPSIAKTLNAKGDIETARKEKEMFNPWMKLFKSGIGTLGYNDSWNLFDQIILSYGLVNNDSSKLQYLAPEIYNRAFMVSQFGRYKGYPHRSFSGSNWIDGYSDHFPTIVYFKKAVK